VRLTRARGVWLLLLKLPAKPALCRAAEGEAVVEGRGEPCSCLGLLQQKAASSEADAMLGDRADLMPPLLCLCADLPLFL